MIKEKQLLLDEIKKKIQGSNGFVTLNYQTFTASRARSFRMNMSEIGAEFEVVKKKVFIQAAKDLGIEINADNLTGHVGVLFVHNDPSTVIKSAVKFSDGNDKSLSLLLGHIDGDLCSAKEIQSLATLPGITEMRSQFLGLLEAPMAQTVQAINAVLVNLLYCLEEKEKQS